MGYRITLRTLSIIDCEQLELASGPDEVISELSLQTLVISNLPLQGAACTLQSLIIVDCPKLAALPEWLPNLTSLQTLGLQDCPKLSSLPEGTQRLTSLTNFKLQKHWRKDANPKPVMIGQSLLMFPNVPLVSTRINLMMTWYALHNLSIFYCF